MSVYKNIHLEEKNKIEQNTKCILCPKVKLDTLPFQQFLVAKYSIYNYRRLSKMRLDKYWNEYRVEMLRLGLLYQPAEMFGL